MNEARLVDVIRKPAEYESRNKPEQREGAQQKSRLLLTHAFPYHHRNEMSGDRVVRRVSDAGAEHQRPKSERPDRLSSGDVQFHGSRSRRVFLLRYLSGVLVAIGAQTHAFRRRPNRQA